MKTLRMKRVVIIGDGCVRYRRVSEIQEMGAVGYTDYVVHGKGSRGIRPRHGEPPNAKIEVIATQEVAEHIFQHVSENYFDKYAMIAFIDDFESPARCEVGRPDFFMQAEATASLLVLRC